MPRPRPLSLRLALLAALGAGLGSGCGSRESAPPAPAQPPPTTASPSTSTTRYKLLGTVRSVEAPAGRVVIAHEEIPGFMGAMTMPFTVKDHSLLEDVKPGDAVQGELRVEKEGGVVKDYELADLVVTAPVLAAPPRKVLSLKNMTVHEAPARLEPGQAVPDFAMTTQDDKPLKLSDLRGDVVVLTFIYTRCPLPDFCPLMDRTFAELAGKLSAVPRRAARVRLLSVSFDPEHDTPEVLGKHAQVQGARPPLWTFAVASHDELAKVAPRLGLMYGPSSNEIIHNLCTVVIDPQGRLVRVETGSAARKLNASELLKLVSPLVPTDDSHPPG